mmetsp:Transcript_2476/g.7604  ORF Transcript_2476/g.7604 Transcript_2476/m.7604 type:complete len:203 (+) Transcript_2476:2391-2999(+)
MLDVVDKSSSISLSSSFWSALPLIALSYSSSNSCFSSHSLINSDVFISSFSCFFEHFATASFPYSSCNNFNFLAFRSKPLALLILAGTYIPSGRSTQSIFVFHAMAGESIPFCNKAYGGPFPVKSTSNAFMPFMTRATVPMYTSPTRIPLPTSVPCSDQISTSSPSSKTPIRTPRPRDRSAAEYTISVSNPVLIPLKCEPGL